MISQVNGGDIGKDDIPKYCGLEPIDHFLDRMDQDVPEAQRISFLDVALMETPKRWWKVDFQVLKD